MGPKRRGMRLVLRRPSLIALALGLGILGAGVAGALSLPAVAAPAAADPEPVQLTYHNGRNFRIPFNLNPQTKNRVKELYLLVSEDQGFHWQAVSKTFPDHPTFTFRSKHDGEYWFAVQTQTNDGRVSPPLDSTIEPNMKVVVDTFPPSLLLEPDERRGSIASVHWEVKDENLNLKSLVLEYQVDGASTWRKVPLTRAKLIGGQKWDAGTAEALKVRASISDWAGNVTDAIIDLAEGTGSPSDLSLMSPGFDDPPGIAQISRGGSDVTAGPGFTPVTQGPASARGSAATSPRPGRGSRTRSADPSGRGLKTAPPNWDRDPAQAGVARSQGGKTQPVATDLFAAESGGGFGQESRSSGPGSTATGSDASAQGGRAAPARRC